MVGPRANWKGYIKFGEVAFPVALFTAASSTERIAFNRFDDRYEAAVAELLKSVDADHRSG
jgi:non-homologous end joining protein Ku